MKPSGRTALFGILLSLIFFSLSENSRANDELRWAADAKSGAPYVFVDPKNPKNFMGFEYDILTRLAEILNRKSVLVQNEWDSLIPGLNRGDYVLAANGIEITPEREAEVLFSEPYYATYEQLVVRKEETGINGLSDVNGKRIGTLKASLGHYILERETKAEVVFYEEESSGYHDVEIGRLDAFFIDFPIALYYALSNPKLKAVGGPIGKMKYGIAISKKNPALKGEIDRGLQEMKRSGELGKILSKWSLLNPFVVKEIGLDSKVRNQGDELASVSGIRTSSISFSDRMKRYGTLLPLLGKGALKSLGISMLAMLVAISFGLLLAMLRLYGKGPLPLLSQSVIEVLRGTPLLIQLYLIFFGLPYLGIHLSPFVAAVIGLGLNYGAYEAENYRAGIEAVPKSQVEAAHALALSPYQRFVYVIFPQAYRIILPPMTNDFISLIKDSSLVSVITMVELTTIYSQLASTYFDHLGLGILVAIIYFLLGYPFVRLARKFEKNLKKKLA
ncbi:MAG: ABC transporter substrate-binding protein/permease [Bdellovibrionales bacterium]|nr:ABC transporter substrate-binding protein/permease [Bdellovibrionales bacterium]